MLTSIQSKYTSIIVLTVTLFLTLLLAVNYYLMKDYSLEQAERTSTLILNGTDSKLDLAFREIESLVSSLARLRAVREVDVDDMSELFISNVLERNEIVRAVYLGTDDGLMFEWGVGEGFTNYTPVFPPDYDPRIRPWYRQAVESGSYGLTSPYVYASVEALGITAVKPVYNEGRFIGVIGLDLILHGLERLVYSLDVPMDGKVILLNQKMEILVNQLFPSETSVVELSTFPDSNLVKEADPFTITEFRGDIYMVSTVENRSTGWKILLFLPYRRIMDFSQRTIEIIIGVDILLMLLLGSLITLVTRRTLTMPLGNIISVFQKFERGDTTARIPILPGREFDLVSRLFNRLSDQSAEFSRKLEERVQQRTRAVVRLQKENVRLRVIDEKERIYRNLHDSLGARLTGINISNHVAKSAWARDERIVLNEMLDRIEKNTSQAILDLKEILKAGEGEISGGRDFQSFIQKSVRERLELKDIHLESKLPGEDELALFDPQFLADCEMIIQELVSNTLKHSGAESVNIELTAGAAKISLKYHDDGAGFNLKEAMKNGFGLQGLFSRAERMGGFLKIVSKYGRGASFNFQFRIGEE